MYICVNNDLVVYKAELLEYNSGGKLKVNGGNAIPAFTDENSVIYTDVTLPDDFIPNCYNYIDGEFIATDDLTTRLAEKEEQKTEELTEQKQALIDTIEPLQEIKMHNKSDSWAIKFQDSENDSSLTTAEKKVNTEYNDKVIIWRKAMREQNDDITTDNTLEEIQARIDRINELYNLYPEVE